MSASTTFTEGKDQLDPVDVEKTRGVANVRIQVERVIGLLRRNFSILSRFLSIDFLISNSNGSQEEATRIIDRIINVSAAPCARIEDRVNEWEGMAGFVRHAALCLKKLLPFACVTLSLSTCVICSFVILISTS